MGWTQDLSVGHPVLDQHHQHLFALLDRIIRIEFDDDSFDAMVDVMAEMNDYILYHFLHEEALMEAAGFPFLDLHRHSHQTIALRVKEMGEALHMDNYKAVALELHQFLSGWLFHHIEIEDFEYRPFLAKGGH